MKKFLMVLLVIMLLAGCVGGVYALSGGFKDWKVNEWFTKAPATPSTTETSDKLAEVASVSLQSQDEEIYIQGENASSQVSLKDCKYFVVKLFDAVGNELDISKYDIKLLMSVNSIGLGSHSNEIAEGYRLKLRNIDDLNIDVGDIDFGQLDGINPNSLFFYNATDFEIIQMFSSLFAINLGGSSVLPYHETTILDYLGLTTDDINNGINTICTTENTPSVNYKIMIKNKIVANYEVPNAG